MRARKVRIQHALPWLVEPLEASWRDEEDEADGEPALVAEWREGIGQPETRRAYAREVRLFLNRYGIRRGRAADSRQNAAGAAVAGRAGDRTGGRPPVPHDLETAAGSTVKPL